MDTTALVIAGVLVVVAGGLLFARSRMGAQLERLSTAQRCRPGDAANAGPGSLVHVTGGAEPGPGGPLRAPVSGTDVVWHRVLVTEQYERTEQDSQGGTRRKTETRTVSDDCSTTPFYLTEAGGRIEVVPAGRQGVRDVALLSDQRDVHGGMRIGTIQLGSGTRQRVQEWGVAVGTPLHAVGELSAGSDGALRLDANNDRQLRVSLLDPETQATKTGRKRTLATVAAAVCAVLAVVALAVGAAA